MHGSLEFETVSRIQDKFCLKVASPPSRKFVLFFGNAEVTLEEGSVDVIDAAEQLPCLCFRPLGRMCLEVSA